MEKLELIERKVKEIGKGYTCNFNVHRKNGKTAHFINGANTICFSEEDGLIICHSTGGSRFAYPDPFTLDQFIEELPKMLLTHEEINNIYESIAFNIGIK